MRIGDDDKDAVANPTTVVAIKVPKQKGRITKNVVKGVAILGPETLVEIGDTPLSRRLPKKSPPVLIKVSDYYMNNREGFLLISSILSLNHIEKKLVKIKKAFLATPSARPLPNSLYLPIKK